MQIAAVAICEKTDAITTCMKSDRQANGIAERDAQLEIVQLQDEFV